MQKNNKHIILIFITLLYILQLCLVFPRTLIVNMQQFRAKNQISKKYLELHKEIALKDWELLDDKKEIKINNTFYDVISFKIIAQKVIVQVAKDDFESSLRISFQNILNNNKVLNSNKKKTLNSYKWMTLRTLNKSELMTYIPRFSIILFSLYLTGKENKVIEFIDRPPC
ncbi:hypothetical protein [Flavobacterium acetivorans]|uniref:hypothetical protein n=1 Tax=Flavobacterium acetivorans TaxID=2893883 RepID=UPI001E56A474|nr:hypothetical protein [Flavobacterium sp. F-29]UFH34325.1 hypothetical protein LNP19_09450 [Flavobacterium sp. F-29]